MASKPVVKVYGKRKGETTGPEYVDVAAFWVNDDGRLGGQWSKDIVAVKVRPRDGGEPYVVKLSDYFCNLRDEREGSQRAGRPAPNQVRKQRREEPPDFGDDDLPPAFRHGDNRLNQRDPHGNDDTDDIPF